MKILKETIIVEIAMLLLLLLQCMSYKFQLNMKTYYALWFTAAYGIHVFHSFISIKFINKLSPMPKPQKINHVLTLLTIAACFMTTLILLSVTSEVLPIRRLLWLAPVVMIWGIAICLKFYFLLFFFYEWDKNLPQQQNHIVENVEFRKEES